MQDECGVPPRPLSGTRGRVSHSFMLRCCGQAALLAAMCDVQLCGMVCLAGGVVARVQLQ